MLTFTTIQVLAIFLLISAPSLGLGATIQYKLSTMEVTGATDATDASPIPDHGFITVTAGAKDIAWPVPTGCSSGHWSWSKIVDSNVNPPTFALRPELKFFRCQLVATAADVDRVASEAAVKLGQGGGTTELEKFRLGMWAHYMLDPDVSSCPPANLTQACVDKRSRATAIKDSLISIFDQIDQVYTDAATFKTNQGW